MKQSEFLFRHMEDLADRAVSEGCAASRFLTPADAQSVAAFFRQKRAAVIFDGGLADAERVRAVFLNPDWGRYNRDELFSAIRIEHRVQDSPGHRDILGALMALGIERDTIGDIVPGEGGAVFLCLPELAGFILENLEKAGRTGVKASIISLGELPDKEEELQVKTDTVASLRLDAVLTAAFNMSRAKSSELIAAGRVSLDHQVCLQAAKELSEGALLSIRGIGRAKLLEVGSMSKKGRIFIQIGLYER
jgi:RNA-binding protein YlmH